MFFFIWLQKWNFMTFSNFSQFSSALLMSNDYRIFENFLTLDKFLSFWLLGPFPLASCSLAPCNLLYRIYGKFRILELLIFVLLGTSLCNLGLSFTFSESFIKVKTLFGKIPWCLQEKVKPHGEVQIQPKKPSGI